MEEDWNEECSDEESPIKSGFFEPPAEEIEKYYNLLDNGELPVLKWESPGYRPPTPKDEPTTPTKEDNIIEDEKSDFDFMDEMSTPRLPVRRDGDVGLKGSAKKKTTSLDGVLSNMRRHWQLDQQMTDSAPEESSTPSTTAASVTTTS